MSKQPKPMIKAEKLGANPFKIPLEIPVTRFTLKGKYVRSEDILLPKTYDVEDQRPVRLYINSDAKNLVNHLNPASLRLLFWVIYSLKLDQDYIYIDREEYMADTATKSLTTYRSALEELIRYNFIQYSVVRNVYWINPSHMFRGNRVRKYPDKLRVREVTPNDKEEEPSYGY